MQMVNLAAIKTRLQRPSARAVYEVRIRPGIMYQPHPCFAKTESGEWLYHNLNRRQT